MSQEESTDTNGDTPERMRSFSSNTSLDREQMVSEYLPAKDDWPAKTVLELNDPATLAALSQMGTMYPEVDDLQPLIDEVMRTFMKSKTSVAGASREEYRSIFESMFGGGGSDDDGNDTLAKLVAADLDDD